MAIAHKSAVQGSRAAFSGRVSAPLRVQVLIVSA
jgi:hypothetical protein